MKQVMPENDLQDVICDEHERIVIEIQKRVNFCVLYIHINDTTITRVRCPVEPKIKGATIFNLTEDSI